MAQKLMSLRDVGNDEIAEICQILTANNIEFYQTEAGNFGISLPALWIKDDLQFSLAQQLFNYYQLQRANNPSSIDGTIWQRFLQEPVKFILYCLAIGFFIYILALPIFDLQAL